MELLIICISKNFNLKNKETLGLLSQNSKYLAHIIVKGFKGNYESIHNFYIDLIENINTVVNIFKIDMEKTSIKIFMHAIQPGLVSKNE